MPPSRADVLEWVQDRLGRTLSPAEQADVLAGTGWDGTAARALMVAFADRFAVDLAGFRPEMHADGTTGPGWPLPARPAHGVRVPVPVSVLHQAAVTGRWPVSYPDLPRVRDLSVANVPLIVAALVGATLAVLWLIPRLF